MPAPDPELIQKMHHWFAVECNNHAWELAERTDRSAEEDRDLLLSASAASYHWARVGTPVNGARADLLLAEVYSQAGRGAEALALAESCCDYFENNNGATWDRAFARLELALAHGVSGNADEASQLLAEAKSVSEELTNADERQVFSESHQRIAAAIAGS